MHINSPQPQTTTHRSTGRGIIKDTESKRTLISSAKNNKFINNYFHESGLPRGVTANVPNPLSGESQSRNNNNNLNESLS